MNGVQAARSVVQNHVTAHSSDKDPIALTPLNDLFHSNSASSEVLQLFKVDSPYESSDCKLDD